MGVHGEGQRRNGRVKSNKIGWQKEGIMYRYESRLYKHLSPREGWDGGEAEASTGEGDWISRGI